MLAVASHHTTLHSDLYLNMNPTLEIDRDDRDEIGEIFNHFGETFRQHGVRLRSELDWNSLPTPKSCYVQAKETGIATVFRSLDPEMWRREYILIQGILEQSDWLASGTQDVAATLKFPQTLFSAKGTPITPDEIQETASKTLGNAFVLRPTGRGKTETALFWARANTPCTRVFYVLPTTVTINAMFRRLERNFPSQTGLYHSSADLFLEQLRADENLDDNYSAYRYFFFPVNVTTPDQIILSLLNYKRYTLKSLPLEGASLILDEIHAYDGETFALVKGMLRHLIETFRTKICVMSATFPDKFQQELSFLKPVLLTSANHGRDEYQARQRTRFRYVDDTLETHLGDILNRCAAPGRVLIVLNTVKRAQNTYREIREHMAKSHSDLNEEDVMLLHSRFTFADRAAKEARLDPAESKFPKVLVATQVVEVSLDISYDTMFTEACYPPDLVQRLGRVNRAGHITENINVFVYRPESHFPYEESPLFKYGLPLMKEWEPKIRSEWDYLTMANQFYDEVWDQFQHEEDEGRYEEVWRKLRYLYSADLSDTEIQRLLRTRSGILTLPAFPASYERQIEAFNKKIEQSCDVRDRAVLFRKKRRLLIDVPVTQRTANLFVARGQDRYIDLPYDLNLGLHINSLGDNII
jgi:CRISPR-associated endonuclease/helicase Cas3